MLLNGVSDAFQEDTLKSNTSEANFEEFLALNFENGLERMADVVTKKDEMPTKLRLTVLLCAAFVGIYFVIFEAQSAYDSVVSEARAMEMVLDMTASTILEESACCNESMTSDMAAVSKILRETLMKKHPALCPVLPPDLKGPIRVYEDVLPMEGLKILHKDLHPGGHGSPANCTARHRVAIIIPYRDREEHLKIFLHNIHVFLKAQQIDYSIFIVEQVANQTFNRGKLMNVGYDVASKLYPWQCYIFHDVDLLPEDDRNMYTCPLTPRHMSVAVDKFNYRLPYASIFGGISALSAKHVRMINGYSNDFWGWGGEDDDLSTRTHAAGLRITRYPSQIARYKMIKHGKDEMNPVNKCRYKIMDLTKSRWKRDGLNSLKYELKKIELLPLYTHVVADIKEKESKKELRKFVPSCA